MHSNLNESVVDSVCCREATVEELELEIFSWIEIFILTFVFLMTSRTTDSPDIVSSNI